MKQRYTSAKTDLKQIPGLYNWIDKRLHQWALLIKPGPTKPWATFNFHIEPTRRRFWTQINNVLDYGGGAGDQLVNKFAERGIRSWVYDPFNRPAAHNALVEKLLSVKGADMVFCANTLNVIREPQVRREALEKMRDLARPGAMIFFSIHEGNKTSKGVPTKRGWQCNRPTKNYLREIRRVFPGAFICGSRMIVAERPDV